ncbi:MAG: HAD-IA family hydrolase [Chloroflexi bacterium]|nr:HAD-IA family hydrolase [Chloroflexota bacterium]
MIKGLIFDFDGLILDTEGPEFQSWEEIFTQNGAYLSLEKWIHAIGSSKEAYNPILDLQGQTNRPVDVDRIHEIQAKRALELLATKTVLPGVEDYLKAAHSIGLMVGLASSSSRDWVLSNLSKLGLVQYFDCFRTSEDVLHVKPDPELFLSALSCLRLTPDEVVVFEDSPNGIHAAKAAGIVAIAVPNPLTGQFNLDEADLVLHSLADMTLQELLDRLSQTKPENQNER